MENLFFDKTSKTPRVFFDYEKGELSLEGISIPENTVSFYRPLMNWVIDYKKSPQKNTVLTLKLEYFNTSTAVVLMNFFNEFISIRNTNLIINWYYESDDVEMEEVGKDYQKILDVDFNLISVDVF